MSSEAPMDLYEMKKLLLELRLTEEQARFAESYAIDANGDKAFQVAGYKSKGQFAKRNIYDLLHNEKVLKYIKALRDNAFLRANIGLDDVIAEYKKMAFTNMADYVDWNNNRIIIKDKDDLSRDQQAGILEITETETKLGTTVTIKLHPKQAALDKLYKMMTEMDQRLKEVQPAGDPKLQLNAKNILVVLGDPKQRASIERLAGSFLKTDLKITNKVRESVALLTNKKTPEVSQEEMTDAMAAQVETERYAGADETRGLLDEHGGKSE